MKKSIITLVLLMVAMIASAKELKTVIFTTTPQMHCANCENKVKGNLRFEKGVKDIKTSTEEQKVYITYDEMGSKHKASTYASYCLCIVCLEKKLLCNCLSGKLI